MGGVKSSKIRDYKRIREIRDYTFFRPSALVKLIYETITQSDEVGVIKVKTGTQSIILK
jgi:hypothetical protein